MLYTIVTHPLRGNYGGMLQAYAMQSSLARLDKQSHCLDYAPLESDSFFLNARKLVAKSLLFLFRKKRIFSCLDATQIAKRFSQHFIRLLPWTKVNQVQKFIVGSDQVWRSPYVVTWGVGLFFLDFATPEQRKRSIAYAASFGTDEWEGTPEETEECGRLLREFKAVSVREHSGVKICKEVFGVDAVQMPDPTLLLHTQDYEKIIDSEKTWLPREKYVAAYVLDETAGKAEVLLNSTKLMGNPLQHLMPHADAKKRRDRFPISVPQWLRLIRDCEYFITDSFHGCVFAIIFNKPFVCLGNEGRGNARFDTLLSTFGLEDRLLTNATPESIRNVLQTPIDWERVNDIHDAERERGINFLKENLSEDDV